MAMALLDFLLLLIAIGVVLYVINRFVPMDGNIKKILNAVVIIVVVLFCLKLFGVFGPLEHVRIGR